VLVAALFASLLNDRDLVRADARTIGASTWALVLAASFGACLVHPQGWHALASPAEQLIRIRTDPEFRASIQEFSPTTGLFEQVGPWWGGLLALTVVAAVAVPFTPALRSPLRRQGLALALAAPWLAWPPVGVGAIAFRVSLTLWTMAIVELPIAAVERKCFRIFVFVGFTVLAIAMVRNIPLIVPAALVILTPVWASAADELADAFPSRAVHRIGVGAVVLLVAVVAWLRLADRLGIDVRAPMRTGWGIDAQRVPVGAMSFVESQSLSGAVLNNFDSGGYLLYRLHPKQRAFIAGNTSMYPPSFLSYYRRAVSGATPDLSNVMSRFAPQLAVVDLASRAAMSLVQSLAHDEAWQLRYFDRGGAVFMRQKDSPPIDVDARARELRDESIPLPSLPTWLGGRPNPYPSLNLAFFLSAIDRPELAAREAFSIWAAAPSEDVARLAASAVHRAGLYLPYLAQLDEAVRRYPGLEDVEAPLLLGLAIRADIAVNARDVGAAESDLHRMLEIQPRTCGPYFALARAAVMRGDTAGAGRMAAAGRQYDLDGGCVRAADADPVLGPVLRAGR
jgi:hypothetical protein